MNRIDVYVVESHVDYESDAVAHIASTEKRARLWLDRHIADAKYRDDKYTITRMTVDDENGDHGDDEVYSIRPDRFRE